MHCLLRFAQRHEGFQLPELKALLELFGIEAAFDEPAFDYAHPFLPITLPTEADAQRILSRTVCIREIIELLAEGADEASLHAQHRQMVPASYYDRYRHTPFAFTVDGLGRTVTAEEKLRLINGFAYTQLQGPISLQAPEVRFTIIRDGVALGRMTDGMKDSAKDGMKDGAKDVNDHDSQLKVFYYGRSLGYGQRGDLINRLSLKRRAYLGTTSMDAELSLLMANLAMAKQGSLVYDPFVGTGSCLIAAAIFGALCLGSDIDGRQMRGQPADGERGTQRRRYPGDKNPIKEVDAKNPVKEPDAMNPVKEPDAMNPIKEVDAKNPIKEVNGKHAQANFNGKKSHEQEDLKGTVISMQNNWEQYGVKGRFVGGLVFDILQHPWRGGVRLFSAICCDPPYGVRAGAKKIGGKKPIQLTTEQRINRYPQTLPYPMDELVQDLFAFAATHLEIGGRLVFWYAVDNPEEGEPPFDEANLPRDARFHRLAAILQPCRDFKRWLLVFSLLAVVECNPDDLDHD